MDYAKDVQGPAVQLLVAVGRSSVTEVSSVPRELRRLSVDQFDLAYNLALAVFTECALDYIDAFRDGKVPVDADHVGIIISSAADIIAGELVEF